MKKILLAFALVAFIFSACEPDPVITPQESGVTVSLSKSSSSNTALSSTNEMISITVSNTSAKDATITWNRTETTSVTGWTYMVNGSADSSGTLSILAGASTTVTFMIHPNDSAGTGSGNIVFYDPVDKALTTQTFTYNHTSIANWFTLTPVGLMSRSIIDIDPIEDYHIYVSNNNTDSVDVRWEREDNSNNPTGWSVVICTDLTCYSSSVIKENFTIAPGDYVDFKLTIDHTSTPTLGSGGSTAKFYVVADSANSYMEQVISHEVTL